MQTSTHEDCRMGNVEREKSDKLDVTAKAVIIVEDCPRNKERQYPEKRSS